MHQSSSGLLAGAQRGLGPAHGPPAYRAHKGRWVAGNMACMFIRFEQLLLCAGPLVYLWLGNFACMRDSRVLGFRGLRFRAQLRHE